eukprot:jgi/Botrbrau1/20640/Bobra.113_1s0064.1
MLMSTNSAPGRYSDYVIKVVFHDRSYRSTLDGPSEPLFVTHLWQILIYTAVLRAGSYTYICMCATHVKGYLSLPGRRLQLLVQAWWLWRLAMRAR